MLGAAGTGESDDEQQQTGRGYRFADQERQPVAVVPGYATAMAPMGTMPSSAMSAASSDLASGPGLLGRWQRDRSSTGQSG